MIRFLARRAWIIALIALIFLFPQALTSQARLNNRVLITGIGIDKTDSGYQVSAQLVIPKGGSDASGEPANLLVITEDGISMIEGLRKVAFKIGKIAGLSHTSFIVLGKSMFDENILTDLDYFIREAQIPNSTMLVYSDGSAKEEIEKLNKMDITASMGLQKVYLYKEESLNSNMITLTEFIRNANQPSHTSVLAQLKVESEENESGSGGSGGSGGEESAGETASPNSGRIIYYTPFAYFKKGKFAGEISNVREIVAYLLTQPGGNRFDIVVENVNDGGVFVNAQVGLRVQNKSVETRVKFVDNRPVLNINITLDRVKLLEVNNEDVSYQWAFTTLKPYKNDALEKEIKNQIKDAVSMVFEKTKAQNIDLFNAADFAAKFNKKEWDSYLKTLANIDDYMQNVDVNISVEIKNFS